MKTWVFLSVSILLLIFSCTCCEARVADIPLNISSDEAQSLLGTENSYIHDFSNGKKLMRYYHQEISKFDEVELTLLFNVNDLLCMKMYSIESEDTISIYDYLAGALKAKYDDSVDSFDILVEVAIGNLDSEDISREEVMQTLKQMFENGILKYKTWKISDSLNIALFCSEEDKHTELVYYNPLELFAAETYNLNGL